jgi:hypothetical protein
MARSTSSVNPAAAVGASLQGEIADTAGVRRTAAARDEARAEERVHAKF